MPLRTIVPVSLDDVPLPIEPERPPEPPAPPAPPLAAPPTPAREAAPPPDGDQPIRKPRAVSATTPERPREADKPPSPRDGGRGERATPFGGKDGAFRAKLCLLATGVQTARAVDDCRGVAAFRTDAIDVAPRAFKEGFPGFERRFAWFGIEYRGRFKVRAGGYYTFRLLSDDGALLYVDGAEVIDNDGQHPPRSTKMSLPLTKGEHEFRLLYYQGPGSRLALQLFVKGYRTEERLFGPEI